MTPEKPCQQADLALQPLKSFGNPYPGIPARRTDRCRLAFHCGKKVARILHRIRNVRGLSEYERYLFARSLAATPDERWPLHENFLRSHDLYTRSARKKYGFKSLE